MENGQWKAPHFWAMLLANALGIAIEIGLVPETGNWHKASMGAMMLLATLGYQSAAKWAAPAK